MRTALPALTLLVSGLVLAQLAGPTPAGAAPAPAAAAAGKPTPAVTPKATPSQDKGCTLSPSLSHVVGEQTSCISVGARLSGVPTVGRTAVLTVTVRAGRSEPGTKVTVDLPTTLEFADGTATTTAHNGGGTVNRAAPTALPLAGGQTRSFTRTVRAVGSGFGEITASARSRVSSVRTDSGTDSVFLTTASTSKQARLGAAGDVLSADQSTARAHYTGAGPERASATPLRSVPAAARPKSQRSTSSADAPGTSCATGHWYFSDQNGVTRAGHNVTVQVRNPSNTVLASAFTGGDGSYTVCYATGGATTSIYLQFRLDNNVWSVQDFNNNVYNYSTGIVSNPDNNTYNFGNLSPAAAADNRAVHAFQEADDEWQWMYSYVSYQGGCWSPLESTCRTLTIHWAADNTSKGTNWNAARGVYLLAGSPDTLDEPVHEYGHALMYELYGQNFPTTDCTTHDLFVVSGPVCGWTEGWADWVATSVYNNTVWTYNGGGQRNFNVTWNEGLGYATGDRVEGRVVQAMRSLTDGVKAPWDNDPGEGGGIKDNSRWFNVMHTYRPNTFADVWNDRAAAGYDTSQTALGALYQGTIDYGFRNPLTDYTATHYPEAVPDHNYSHTTNRSYWSVVAVKPDSGSDVDLTLYNDYAQSSSLASSSFGNTATDFVGINSNSGHRAFQTYYPRVHRFSGTGGYTVEEAQGSNILSSTNSVVLGSGQPVRVWDHSQTVNVPVYYRAVGTSGQDLQLASLSAGSDLVSRSGSSLGSDPGVGVPATLVVNPSASGYSGLVLLNNSLAGGSVNVYADTTAPTGTATVDQATTHTGDVTLTISAGDAQTGVSGMQISTDGTFDTEPVLPYAATGTAHLTGPSGVKTVYTRFLNNAGMWSTPTSDTVQLALPPAISAVSPASGPLGGAQTVVITGTDFTGATKVKFGSAAATSFTVNSSTQITAVTPAHAAGTKYVVVTTGSGSNTGTASSTYTWQAAPSVTSVSAAVGPTTGGKTVTIKGTGFKAVTAVMFSTTPATSFTVVSSTKITAVTPAHAAGTGHVLITTNGGTSASATGSTYTWQAAPTITSVSAASGPAAGGNTVTITGTKFTGVTSVKFGSAKVTSYTVVSATKITATVPAHAAGTVHVVVTTPGGSNAAKSGAAYKYV